MDGIWNSQTCILSSLCGGCTAHQWASRCKIIVQCHCPGQDTFSCINPINCGEKTWCQFFRGKKWLVLKKIDISISAACGSKTWKRTGWQMAPLVELILWSWADGALSEALSPVVSWLNLYPGTNGFTDNCLCFHNQLCLRTKWPNNCQHMVIMPNLQRAAIPARINGKHVRSIFLQLDRKVSCVA